MAESEDFVDEATTLLIEAVEPGVFGYGKPASLDFLRSRDEWTVDTVVALCEKHGYGFVMQIAESAWEKKHPGCGITLAAVGSVRERWCRAVKDLLLKATR